MLGAPSKTMRKEVTFFNDKVGAYDKEYERETPDGYSFRVRRERVLELLPDGAGKHVLDIAGGPGVMVEGLNRQGWRVDCVDAAPEMIELAHKKYGHLPNTRFAVGDVYALNYPDATFDAVTAMGLVEYLDDQNKAMAEMARVTKPGGDVIITFPNQPSFWRTWARVLRSITALPRRTLKMLTGKKPYPISHKEYTQTDAWEYMERHGLQPLQTVYYNFKVMPYPFDLWFPRLTVRQSALLERPGRSGEHCMATAFIVHARKK